MAHFLVLTTFASQEKRDQHRARHRAYLHELVERGVLLIAGPLTDDSGGLLIFNADSEEAVRDIMNADPFTTEGAFATIEIKEFRQVAP